LAERLEEANLRQLKQRVVLRAQLQPFELEDTSAYMASRIMTAGGNPDRMFSLEAVMLIHELSGGIPRTISVICDNALLNGMALGRPRVDRAAVAAVCRDLHLMSPRRSPYATSPARQPEPALVLTPLADTEDKSAASDAAKTDIQNAAKPSRPAPLRLTATASSRRVGRTITE
jgi:hypothetical protein